MARFPVAGVFVDGQGNIVPNGTVTVYTYLSSAPSNPTTKATIYASDTGASTTVLGVVTSDSSNGTYLFWVDDGDYGGAQVFTIVLSKTSHVRTLYHQAILLTASGVNVALDNLASVAINESLISDTDVTDDLGTGDIRWKDTWFETLSSGLTAGDTLKLRGRDVNGAAYVDILTITSNNTVTADLHSSVTHNSNTILTSGNLLDEDDMSSNSAVLAASQQSIKAYVDSQIQVHPKELRHGFNCKQASTVTITIEGGSINVDGTIVTKTADTTLNLTTAAHWVGGSSQQTTSAYGWIYVDASGNILMENSAPDESDTSGNTSGILRYNDFGGATDYRCIGWFYMNATGAGELNSWEVSNLKDGDAHNAVTNPITGITLDDASWGTDLDTVIVHFYSSGRPVLINGGITATTAGGANNLGIQIHDGAEIATTIREVSSITTDGGVSTHHLENYAQGTTTFKIQGEVSASSHTVTGVISVTEQ